MGAEKPGFYEIFCRVTRNIARNPVSEITARSFSVLQSKIQNRKSKIVLPTADGGDEYNFVAVLENGFGGDEFQIEAEAGAIAPLF